MMKRQLGRCLKTIGKDKRGSSTPVTIALVLVILLITCGIAEFARLAIIVSGVRDSLQQAVISVAVTNYDELYHGLREGYSGGYQLTDGVWEEHLEYDDIYARLDELLGTRKNGSYHLKEAENGYEYRLSGLDLNILNPDIAPESADVNFEAVAVITIEIPLSFGWELVPPLKMELRTKAIYMPKF